MAVDVATGLEQGYTLPASWYQDPEVYHREQEHIFRRTWLYAGHVSRVAEPGDYFTCRAGDVPLVVVRDHDENVNAFVNICRHRWTEVVQGSGHRETLQCPYHAWTYGLDGCLRAAPRSDGEPDFDKSELGLIPVRVELWGPLVFVNLDREAASLAEILGELPAAVADGGVDLGRLRLRQTLEYELAANWKIVVENFLECYHCPVAHPSFSDVIDVDPDRYVLEANEWYSSQRAPVRRRALEGSGPLPYDPGGAISESQFHLLWPNFTLNVIPGPQNMITVVFVPDGPERTRAVAEYFFAEDADERQVEAMIAFGDAVGREDQELVESIQRALRSEIVDRGRLLLGSEHLIQHFQRLVERSLA